MALLPLGTRSGFVGLLFLLGGCFQTSQTGAVDSGVYGFSSPTLELTVNGVHFGPSVADVGSVADFVTTYDQTTARAQQSTLQIVVSSAATGASCAFGFARYGDGVAPFHVGGYQISSGDVFGTTPDGTAMPISSESVDVPQGAASCAGSDCDGAVLYLNDLQQDHVQGSLSATMQNAGVAASVVCTFFVPTRTYQP
jgi:hypothetical protein